MKPTRTFKEWNDENFIYTESTRAAESAYNAGFHRAHTCQQEIIDKLRRILIQVNYHTSLVDNDFAAWPY